MRLSATADDRFAEQPARPTAAPRSPSRALVPIRRRPPARLPRLGWSVTTRRAAVALLALTGTVAVCLAAGGWLRAAAIGPGTLFANAAGALGCALDQVLVVGATRTDSAALRAAIQIEQGAPLLAIDLDALRRRLEALPWVERAIVERVLPDRLTIRLSERVPFALWQHDGRFSIIDAKGNAIDGQPLDGFEALPQVVGADAPAHAEDVVMMLGAEPDLFRHVTAATRVGARRWDITLDQGVTIRLPEDDAAGAWSRVARLAREDRLFERAIKTVDLRLPDRMIVALDAAALGSGP